MVVGAGLTPPVHEWAQHVFGQRVHATSGAVSADICCPCMLLFPSNDILAEPLIVSHQRHPVFARLRYVYACPSHQAYRLT